MQRYFGKFGSVSSVSRPKTKPDIAFISMDNFFEARKAIDGIHKKKVGFIPRSRFLSLDSVLARFSPFCLSKRTFVLEQNSVFYVSFLAFIFLLLHLFSLIMRSFSAFLFWFFLNSCFFLSFFLPYFLFLLLSFSPFFLFP